MAYSTEASFEVPATVRDSVELALLRVRNLFPEIEFQTDGHTIFFVARDEEMALRVKLELSNALYRQKIYKETRAIREALYTR